MECRAFARLGFHPNAAAVLLDYFFADGKSDASALVALPGRRTLE